MIYDYEAGDRPGVVSDRILKFGRWCQITSEVTRQVGIVEVEGPLPNRLERVATITTSRAGKA